MSAAIDAITPRELDERRKRGQPAALIDVRTPAEFREVHAAGAENLPLDQLEGARLNEFVQRSSGEPLYVICQSGSRSTKAYRALTAAGAANITNVEGGTRAWTEAGLSVERGKKSISLERQVRIAAGSLVVLGVLLAMFVHPAFIGLSAFIGAGLVFSGVTDTCGMGLVLAKMPWNRS